MGQVHPDKAQDVDARFQLLLTLLALVKSARHKSKKTELEFQIVNQTFNLVRYRHCVYWERVGGQVTIVAMSGLVHIDPGGPYAQWLKKAIEAYLRNKFPNDRPSRDLISQNGATFSLLAPVTLSNIDTADRAEWEQWSAPHAMIAPMRDRHGKIFGGIWIDRDEPFNELETAILEDLADGYAHSLHHFVSSETSQRKARLKSFMTLSRSNAMRVAAVVLLIMLVPVRMSATAPAEVVAHNPEVVSVPYDATIESIEVLPGQIVKKGDLLARLDSTVLGNRTAIAETETQAAEIALRKTERESLADKSKLAELAVLRAQLQQKNAERSFAEDMLRKSEIRAERDGVVIFSDVSALRGKPVRTGEQIMLLADPKDSELLIRVPVDAMIEINQKVPARFYLNISPLSSEKAVYESIGYQATPDPDGLMTYKIRARFADVPENLRIGWTGVAKIYGDKTILALNILRRPIVTLRRKLGL